MVAFHLFLGDFFFMGLGGWSTFMAYEWITGPDAVVPSLMPIALRGTA
ncbi:hypothetical protein ACFQDR_07015 [Sulfitobacter sediminilitoris]